MLKHTCTATIFHISASTLANTFTHAFRLLLTSALILISICLTVVDMLRQLNKRKPIGSQLSVSISTSGDDCIRLTHSQTTRSSCIQSPAGASAEDGEELRKPETGWKTSCVNHGWYAMLVVNKNGRSETLAVGRPVPNQTQAPKGLLIVLAAEVQRVRSQWQWQKAPVAIAKGGFVVPSTQRQSLQEPPVYQEKRL